LAVHRRWACGSSEMLVNRLVGIRYLGGGDQAGLHDLHLDRTYPAVIRSLFCVYGAWCGDCQGREDGHGRGDGALYIIS